MELVLVLGLLVSLFCVVFVFILTPLFDFLVAVGYPHFSTVFVAIWLCFEIPCSFLWGAWFHFSFRQFLLLARYNAVFGIGLPLTIAGYNQLVFLVLAPIMHDPESPAIVLLGIMNVLFIGFLGLMKKLFGHHASRYFRIEYLPKHASIETASKFQQKARHRLAENDYRGASANFHSAAGVHAKLAMWKEAADDYSLAAENLSKANKSSSSSVAWLYTLSAASYILADRSEAEDALVRGRMAVDGKEIGNWGERVLLILDFLSAVQKKDVQQVQEKWPGLNRKMRKWECPTIEETLYTLGKLEFARQS